MVMWQGLEVMESRRIIKYLKLNFDLMIMGSIIIQNGIVFL